jgi:biotin carboxylase
MHLVVLNATYRDKRSMLATARAMGLFVSVVGPELPAWASADVDRFVLADPDDVPGVVAAARALHAERPVDGVLSLWDRDVPLCARVAAALGLRGCGPAAADRARHKYRAREALRAAGIPQPRYAEVSTWQGLVEASTYVGFPLVYKPVGASASRAILRVDAHDGLAAAHALMETWADPSIDPMFGNHPGVRLVEEFMDGPEVSVEGVTSGGRVLIVGVTRKWTTADYFLEWRHAFPAGLPPESEARVREMASAAVLAIGLDDCGFHVELKLTPRGCRVVEVNGRLGSDYIATHLVPLASGFDLVRANLRVVLGLAPGEAPTRHGAACVRFLFGEADGVVERWRGVERARRLPGVVDVELEKEPGQRVMLPPRRFTESRLAHVVAVGDDTDEAIARAEAAIAELSCRLDAASNAVAEPT